MIPLFLRGISQLVTDAWTQYKKLPQPVRSFITDCVESGGAAFVALNLAFPTSWQDAQHEAIIASVAVGAAIISTIRRELPALWAYLVTDPLAR